MSSVCSLFFRWMFVVSGKHLYSCASSVQRSVCVHYSFGNIRLIEPFYVRSLFVATGPCSLQYVPVCSPSPKSDGLVILSPDTIFLYSAMYVDPVRLSVTGPLRENQHDLFCDAVLKILIDMCTPFKPPHVIRFRLFPFSLFPVLP